MLVENIWLGQLIMTRHRDEGGWTPLMYACAHVRSAFVAMLLARGAQCGAQSFLDFKFPIELVSTLAEKPSAASNPDSRHVWDCLEMGCVGMHTL